MADRPPLAVLVSGAPGSGKSTLADALAPALDVAQVSKDRLVHGIWRTAARASELGAPGVEPFYRTMELWLELGVSFVADQTFYPVVSAPDVARRLMPHGVVLNVHCASARSMARFEQRMREDPLCGGARLANLLPLAERLAHDLDEPLPFGCPVLAVNTDEGFRPGLDDVVAWVDGHYGRPLVHDLDRAEDAPS